MSHKLLLADDSVTIQRVIELTFAGEDVKVLAVGDGEQAIARVQTDQPDIVLADIAMPKRNGYDVAAFIKSRPELSHIPVLLLAGAFEPVDDARARQAGCDGVLVKPFEPQHVIARVRELLAGAKGSPTQATADVPRPVERLAPHRPFDPAQGKPAEAPRREASAPPGPGASGAGGHDQPGFRPEEAPVPTPGADVDLDFGVANLPLQGVAREETGNALDDYFDRLDAAFANLGGSSPPPAPSGVEGPSANPVEQTVPGFSERPSASPTQRPVAHLERAPKPDRPILEKDLDWFDQPTTIDVPVERTEAVSPAPERVAPTPLLHPSPSPPREIAAPVSPAVSPIEQPAVAQADEPWYKPAAPAPVERPAVSAVERPVAKPLEPPPPTFASPPPPAADWPASRPSTSLGTGPIQPPPIEPPESPPTMSAQSSPLPPPSPEPPRKPDAAPFDTAQGKDPSTSPGTGRAIADAFSALLAVEQGEPGAVPVRLAVGPSNPEIDDALIEDITRRVAERLGPGAVRDVVRDIVSKVAERIVREELDRLKNKKR
jgi:CheY-like chemotaxis protein